MTIEITEGVINTRNGYLCSGSGGPPHQPHDPTNPPAPVPEPDDEGEGEDEEEQEGDE